MTFLRLAVNFSSLQLTDICKKVSSHAKSSVELIFVVAKNFKARRTPRTVVPGYVYQQRGEKMQNVPNKRIRNSLNNKFWLGTFFTINLFLQLLAIKPSLQAFIVLFSLSGRRQNDCSTRMQLQKRKETTCSYYQ